MQRLGLEAASKVCFSVMIYKTAVVMGDPWAWGPIAPNWANWLKASPGAMYTILYIKYITCGVYT